MKKILVKFVSVLMSMLSAFDSANCMKPEQMETELAVEFVDELELEGDEPVKSNKSKDNEACAFEVGSKNNVQPSNWMYAAIVAGIVAIIEGVYICYSKILKPKNNKSINKKSKRITEKKTSSVV